jgi:hypothetical protein
MSEELVLAIILLLLASGMLAFFVSLTRQQRRRAAQTEEEWEQRERGANLLGASALALDQILRADMKAGIEFQQDELRGQTQDRNQTGGQSDRTAKAIE